MRLESKVTNNIGQQPRLFSKHNKICFKSNFIHYQTIGPEHHNSTAGDILLVHN